MKIFLKKDQLRLLRPSPQLCWPLLPCLFSAPPSPNFVAAAVCTIEVLILSCVASLCTIVFGFVLLIGHIDLMKYWDSSSVGIRLGQYFSSLLLHVACFSVVSLQNFAYCTVNWTRVRMCVATFHNLRYMYTSCIFIFIYGCASWPQGFLLHCDSNGKRKKACKGVSRFPPFFLHLSFTRVIRFPLFQSPCHINNWWFSLLSSLNLFCKFASVSVNQINAPLFDL